MDVAAMASQQSASTGGGAEGLPPIASPQRADVASTLKLSGAVGVAEGHRTWRRQASGCQEVDWAAAAASKDTKEPTKPHLPVPSGRFVRRSPMVSRGNSLTSQSTTCSSEVPPLQIAAEDQTKRPSAASTSSDSDVSSPPISGSHTPSSAARSGIAADTMAAAASTLAACRRARSLRARASLKAYAAAVESEKSRMPLSAPRYRAESMAPLEVSNGALWSCLDRSVRHPLTSAETEQQDGASADLRQATRLQLRAQRGSVEATECEALATKIKGSITARKLNPLGGC